MRPALLLLLTACAPEVGPIAWTSPVYGVGMLQHGCEDCLVPEQVDALTEGVALKLGGLGLSVKAMADAAAETYVQAVWEPIPCWAPESGNLCRGHMPGLVLKVLADPWIEASLRHELTHRLLGAVVQDPDNAHARAGVWP